MQKIGFLIIAIATLQGGDMVTVRKSEDRGKADHGWLVTEHTFSFSDYYDPKFMGFRTLRVINEDVVLPKKGFDTHPHSDMEILTYVIEGALEHKDTMGNHSQIKEGEFQLMTAGTGVEHSEFNPSEKEAVHLLQIWIHPEKKGLVPSYQQKSFSEHKQGLKLVVSPEGKEGSLKIHQEARIYLGRLDKGKQAELSLGKNRHAWIQVVQGRVDLNGVLLKQGDGAAVSGEEMLSFKASEKIEFLLFDLL